MEKTMEIMWKLGSYIGVYRHCAGLMNYETTFSKCNYSETRVTIWLYHGCFPTQHERNFGSGMFPALEP